MDQRRVVTGTQDGREAIVRDERVDGIRVHGSETTVIFTADGVLSVPNDGEGVPLVRSLQEVRFPAAGALLVGTFRLAPNSTAVAPGPSAHDSEDRPGYHSTDSVDVDIVLEGEIVYEGEGGSLTTLRRGDWIIVNGTKHAWHNKSSADAMVLSVVCGARRLGGE